MESKARHVQLPLTGVFPSATTVSKSQPRHIYLKESETSPHGWYN